MMNNHIHLSICTTLSMIITFLFYIIFEQRRADYLLVQYFPIDILRDYFLSYRCWFEDRYGMYLF